jgi:hypothetical protein
MATNPLIGAGWGQQAPNQSGTQGGGSGTQGLFSNPIQATAPPNTPNPGGYSNPGGSGVIQNNLALENLQTGALKNQLAPQWANLMGQYGGQAGNFYGNLMNLGSPYYQQQQQSAFTQGVGQNQNAMSLAKQQLGSQGYGATPSGANAAMIGGMNMQGSQNLAEQYLQNLFQNEAMQLQGASGLAGLAQTFNPSSLLGGTSSGINYQKPTSGLQNVLGGIQAAQGIAGLGAGL